MNTSSAGCQPAMRDNSCFSSSIPEPCLADKEITTPVGSSCRSGRRPAKSILLCTVIRAKPSGNCARMASSTACTPCLASTIRTNTSAFSISFHVRAMPIRSTSSLVSRRPAVSMTCKGIPCTCNVLRTTSRVVPATGVTMARSSPAKLLSRLDFPTFGCPARTTCSPP